MPLEPLENYGVLKARPIVRRLATHTNAHYQVHLIDLYEDTDYRVAINVRSQLSPSELAFWFHADCAATGWHCPRFYSGEPLRPGDNATVTIRAAGAE
jgi:hypothetical protein